MRQTVRNTLFWNDDDPCTALEQVNIGRRMDASIFLHGFCAIFALALHETFGYDIKVVAEADLDGPWQSRLIHVYCRDNDDNYIDVRGITDDEYAFLGEFDYFSSVYDNDSFTLSENELRDFSCRKIPKDEFDWLYGAAQNIINAHRDGYIA